MQEKLTFWIKLREFCIFLLIWPIFPLVISESGVLDYSPASLFAPFILLPYNFFGWYIAARVYQHRTKKYVRDEDGEKPYSLKKEIALFLLIWPIAPILIHTILYCISFAISSSFRLFEFLFMISTYWGIFGWGLAIYIYNRRRKGYFKNHVTKQKQKRNRIGRFIPFLIVLIILGTVVSFVAKMVTDFIDDGHRDLAPNGEKIRLEISEEECQKYPNRYYFKNLCILCPDGQPLVDGHCQRCPKGQFVISNGCRGCDYNINFITPKVECDACPNRIYENGLCKPLHHLTSFSGCDDRGSWPNSSKEDCDACPNRKYVLYSDGSGGNCELILHGWQKVQVMKGGFNRGFTVDKYFYDENGDLAIDRDYYDEQHLKSERHLKEDKYLTYFKNGQLRTEEEVGLMKGYYANGILAFELKSKDVYFYNKTGEQIAQGTLTEKYQPRAHQGYLSEIYIIENNQKRSISEKDFWTFLEKNYDIDFRLPFPIREKNGKITHYGYFGVEAEKKFNRD